MVLPLDEAGDGPALVLLHAGIADRTMWSDHLAPLAEAGFRAIAPDMPGFGSAPVAEDEDAPWNDVLRTMDALSVARAAMVGCSFGGAIAVRVAVTAPERVSGLALCSAPSHDVEPSAELEAAWAAEEAAIERGDTDAAVAAVVDTWTLPDAPAELRARVATMQRRALAQQAAATAPPEAEDPLANDPDSLDRLGLPALVAVGEHDKQEFHQAAEVFARRLHVARPVTIAGAGHLAPLETPETFRRLLLEFLA
jgi:pimeloyl-ACP methyl ester carboxylesterase